MPFEIIQPGTRIDFIRFARPAAILSILLIVVSLAAIGPRGFRLGIDFAGGTEVQLHFTGGEDVDEGAIRAATNELVPDASVVRFGASDTREYLLRFKSDQGEKGEKVDAIAAKLREDIGPLEVDRVEYVGPKVGAELRAAGFKALGLAGLMVLVYIAFRFSARFAPGAIVAVLHDVMVTAGIFILLGMEFDLRVLAALLAIVGYSLNDTIIIYDRIRENMELHTNADLPDVINRSINQMLGRTVLTSGTTLVAVIALLVLGGPVIRPFAFAMTIGILVGTYSSIYIASPILILLERWQGPEKAAKPKAKAKAAPQV